jgi:predicted extracellular nuclease
MTPSPTHGRVAMRLASAGALLLAMLAAIVGAAPQRALAAAPDLFFSEYIEGSSNNKALEIYNGTGGAINLGTGGYNVQMFFNGSATAGLTINLTGTVADGDVYVVAQASAAAAILTQADQTNGSGWFNGDDAVVLRKGTAVIDVIGVIGFDPGTEWGTGLVSSADNTLQRKAAVCAGDTNSADAFDPSVEWDGFASDTFSGLGSHSASCGTPPATAVSVAASDASAAEAGPDSGDFTISRSGATTNALAVSYSLSGASAADYTPALTGSATIPAGEASVVLSITPVDDSEVEGSETLTLTLGDGADYDLGSPASAGITIADNDVAGPTITRVHAIQGSGNTAAAGSFTVEAIVVGDYQTQGSGQLRGFFIQEEDPDVDADPATSEGIFVFCTTCPVPVSVGDKVQVTGMSSEFFNMSQLTASTAGSVSVLSSGNPLPTAASVQLPVPGVPTGDLGAATTAINAYFEPFEGMLVTFPDTLSVSEYFELARYGQVILNEGGRPYQFTHANTPTAAGFIDHEINVASRTIILDDTDNRQNRPVDVPNTNYYHPVPGLSTSNFFRGGDTITNLTGVLHWSFAGQGGTDAWRIRPVTEAYSYAFTPVNTRPQAAPSVGGTLKVASFNVLNYFLSIDTTNVCAPTQNQDCRGADSAEELERQRTKLLAALQGLDADVIGVMEMENTPGVEPLADIVAGLPGYAYVDTGVIGTDAIRVGIIYDATAVTPVGDHAVLDTQAFVNPRNATVDRNRPAVAQTFEEIGAGARFTVVVNHLKSKGSGCGVDDDDTTTGQGNCTLTRTLAAQELASWLASDPTGSGDSDVLIIGDLNSYAKEEPIVALQNAGYSDLVAAFLGAGAYGYVFDGQLGYLDHALANSSLVPQIAGVADWHINADEIPLFDYNDDARTADEASFEEESDTLPLYEPDEFRTSDHDPVVIGLSLNALPTIAQAAYAGVCALDGSSGGLKVVVSDRETAAGALTLSFATAPGISATETNNAGAERTVTFTASDNTSGAVTITVTDAGGETASLTLNIIAGSGANQTLNGGEGIDVILGRGGNDRLNGAEGDDVLCGGSGNDVLNGGEGADTLDGGSGNDQLSGGEGDNKLLGGAGNDELSTGSGADKLYGESGNDEFTGGSGADLFDGGPDNDTVTDFNADEGDTQTGI